MLGVLLALHGSRVNSWKETAMQYVDLLKKDFPLIEYGFIEFNTPSLRDAAESLVSQGADRIVVLPLLFAAGAHFKRDIPRLLELKEDKYIIVGDKMAEVVIGNPVGVDKRVAEVLKERVNESIKA